MKLVYLDPPYWKQAEGEYGDDPTDLANMPLEEFNKTLAGIINGLAKKLRPGAVIALLMQPTQWRAPERQYTDHVADMIRLVKLPIDMAAVPLRESTMHAANGGVGQREPPDFWCCPGNW